MREQKYKHIKYHQKKRKAIHIGNIGNNDVVADLCRTLTHSCTIFNPFYSLMVGFRIIIVIVSAASNKDSHYGSNESSKPCNTVNERLSNPCRIT
jgi:hypothetical protein